MKFESVFVESSKTIVVIPVIEEGMHSDLKEAVARRRMVYLGKDCPCGASINPPLQKKGKIIVFMEEAEHSAICLGHIDNVLKQYELWEKS